MDKRQHLYELVQSNLNYATSTTKLRWIMDSNGWKTAEDVRDNATDEQVEAFIVVWGVDAYVV